MSIQPKVIEFPYIDHQKESMIEEGLEKYLVAIGKINLFQSLSYILKEMIGNANKANLKRIHFSTNKLDINYETHYKEGMKSFKENYTNLSAKYYKEAERLGYYVKVDFSVVNNMFILSVKNSNPLVKVEKERIASRIKKASKFKNMEEALIEGLDTEEGAGFGLIITTLMLRKIGLDEKVFNIHDNDKYTEAKLTIPMTLVDKDQEEIIAEAVKREIKNIPQFPDHIIQLERKLSNPNSNFSDLSEIINHDPSLIADLLKVANSSIYMLHNKVKSIEEAVSQIGFEGVKNLILTYSAQKILMDKYRIDTIKEVITHSIEVAHNAYEIAKKFNFKSIRDQVYTAAILHDFGKIIIHSLKPDISDKINKICIEKGIGNDVLENLTDGYNHAIIGAKLCEKWNFSEDLIQAIRYHHIPLESDIKHQEIVFVVYLANIIYYYKRNEFKFENINYQVLKYLKMTEESNFKILTNSIISVLNRIKNAS